MHGFEVEARSGDIPVDYNKDALSLVDVRVLDHFVVGAEDVTSFAELGLL
jgi:RadC-like JAB domain-containing protein